MAKRIVSGIFILTALGALGVILAGAMTSGEQLIVRFLTAVTVAALALYVISDLRLQNEQEEQPNDRQDFEADRSTRRESAAVATATPSHRRERFTRRGRHSPPASAPNFEAIEPVTARSRAMPSTDPAEAVTGSRLVAAAPDQVDRVVPPHPMAAHRSEQRIGRSDPPATRDEPAPPGTASGSSADRLEDVAGLVAGPVELTPEFPDTADERARGSSLGSAIVNTSFTYSGRLHSLGADWPPKPTNRDDMTRSDRPGFDDDAEAEPKEAEAPTAELPALTGLPILDIDDPLHDLYTKDVDGTDDDPGREIDPVRPETLLFAVDTAELLLMEPADSPRHGEKLDFIEAFRFEESEYIGESLDPIPSGKTVTDPAGTGDSSGALDDLGSTWPMAGGPPIPTGPSFRQLEAAQYATPTRTDHLDLLDVGGTRDAGDRAPTDGVARPLEAVPRPGSPPPDKLSAAIRSGEIQVINSLISQGMLSTSGPITDRDVRTMVYVAFTSNELRKLILAGGTPDGIRAEDLDLGEVELFDESRFAPTPKRLYPGRPGPPLGDGDDVLDLVALEAESATGSPIASDATVDRDLDPELVPNMPTPRHLYRRVDADRVDR